MPSICIEKFRKMAEQWSKRDGKEFAREREEKWTNCLQLNWFSSLYPSNSDNLMLSTPKSMTYRFFILEILNLFHIKSVAAHCSVRNHNYIYVMWTVCTSLQSFQILNWTRHNIKYFKLTNTLKVVKASERENWNFPVQIEHITQPARETATTFFMLS